MNIQSRLFRQCLVLLPLTLAACANTPLSTGSATSQSQANTLTDWYRGCLVYHGMQAQIAKKMQTLPIASARKVLIASDNLAHLCETTPSDPAVATAQVTAALTTIGIEAAIPTK